MKKYAISSIIIFFVLQAHATILPYKSFDDLINEADGIIIGTVSQIEPFKDETGIFYTYITLSNIQILYGAYNGKKFTLRMIGGEIGEEKQAVVGSPNFQIRQRLILFIRGNGKNLVPLVGWGQGMFLVRKSNKKTDLAQEIICDSQGNQIFAIESGHVIKEQQNKSTVGIVKLQMSDVHESLPSEEDIFISENNLVIDSDHNQISYHEGICLNNFLMEIQKRAELKITWHQPLISVSIEESIRQIDDRDATPQETDKEINEEQLQSDIKMKQLVEPK